MSATLARFPETLALVRMAAGSEVPAWVESSSVFSVTATAAETALVCAARSVPRKVRSEGPWTAFAVAGETVPDLGGPAATARLHDLLAVVVEEEVAARVVATFDTDWLLVPVADADRAEEAWRRRGHTVAPAVPATAAPATGSQAAPPAPRSTAPRKSPR